MTQDEIGNLIRAAAGHGLRGFGGACGEAAVAINRVVFDGKGTIVAALNEAFLDRGRQIGHVAVLHDGVIWDADGRPKGWDDIESWGMLDVEDSDYREQAAALGFAWDDAAAGEVARVEYDDEGEVLTAFGSLHLDRCIAALEAAKAGPCPTDEPEDPEPGFSP